MGISRCFLSTVQKTWNKVRVSVIKRPSHSSRGWIKASCSESMRFCKKNIHISNIINTFILTSADCDTWKPFRRMTYDVGVAWLVTSMRENKTKRRSRIRSTKRGFVKKNVRGFRYKPSENWFSFAKVRKLCFLCSCKQTCGTSISQRRATPTSYVIRRNSFRVRQIA